MSDVDWTKQSATITKTVEESLERLHVQLYYFGFAAFFSSGHPRPPKNHVIAKLIEWHKGDPKPWDERQYRVFEGDKDYTIQIAQQVVNKQFSNMLTGLAKC